MNTQTIREAADAWLFSKKDTVANTTYSRYEEALERSVLPEYGDRLVEEITEDEIDRFIKSIAERSEREGRQATLSMLQMSGGILSAVADFARGEPERSSLLSIAKERKEYEALSPDEIRRVCHAVKFNVTEEMMAVLLSLFCGIRIGELCALDWCDVDLEGRRIYVHQSAHRVRASRDAETRTVQNRVKRIFDAYKIKNVNFQRLNKTYVKGQADPAILTEVFGD